MTKTVYSSPKHCGEGETMWPSDKDDEDRIDQPDRPEHTPWWLVVLIWLFVAYNLVALYGQLHSLLPWH